MSKSLRLSEKWFRRGLWVIAFFFGGFLISFGGKIIEDLPSTQTRPVLEDYMDPTARKTIETTIQSQRRANEAIYNELAKARLQKTTAENDFAAANVNFNNWLATRQATQNPEQDVQLIAGKKNLEKLKNKERETGVAVEKHEKIYLNTQQAIEREQQKLNLLQQEAYQKLEPALRKYELKIFLYRLALTLPLLVIAGWLFAKKRKTKYWPFVWGFIYFALFAFFFELVPYLPNYGGYVRYIIGLIVTIIIGRQAIISLSRYLEKQKTLENLPEIERRKELSYDSTFALLTKGICPGCERTTDLKDPEMNFCMHCGLNLFNQCPSCNTRKSSFSKFCFFCGK
jgi:rubrerythrin